jgi:ubiquinone/menaquinone biosynthesis C-methylase UbiE
MKIDIGCGTNCKEGFEGIDSIDFGQKYVGDALEVLKGFDDDSVEEFHCSHFIEHLDWPQRIIFFNELGRVLKQGAKGQLIVPHWNSCRFYGDPTHKEPMSEFAFYYLSAEWRKVNAPHVPYTCDLDCTWGYSLHPSIVTRTVEFQQYAMQWFKEACQDIICNVTKK